VIQCARGGIERPNGEKIAARPHTVQHLIGRALLCLAVETLVRLMERLAPASCQKRYLRSVFLACADYTFVRISVSRHLQQRAPSLASWVPAVGVAYVADE